MQNIIENQAKIQALINESAGGFTVIEITGAYDANINECIWCNTGGGNFPINLPLLTPEMIGQEIIIKTPPFMHHAIAVTPQAANKIDTKPLGAAHNLSDDGARYVADFANNRWIYVTKVPKSIS